jgi:predicted dinucleotide-binding enzyme
MKTCKQINSETSSSTLVEDLVSNHNEMKAYKEMMFERLKNK